MSGRRERIACANVLLDPSAFRRRFLTAVVSIRQDRIGYNPPVQSDS